MVKLTLTLLTLVSSSLVLGHAHPDVSSHQIRNLAQDEIEIRKLKIRHPLVYAKVNGIDPALLPRAAPQPTLIARKAQQAAASASASASASGAVPAAASAAPPLTFTASGINVSPFLFSINILSNMYARPPEF